MGTIFIFAAHDVADDGRCWYAAMAEDGTILAGHGCTNIEYAKHDLMEDQEFLPGVWAAYAGHYPGGFDLRLVRSEYRATDTEWHAAMGRHFAHSRPATP